jgi:hypothetical protein
MKLTLVPKYSVQVEYYDTTQSNLPDYKVSKAEYHSLIFKKKSI